MRKSLPTSVAAILLAAVFIPSSHASVPVEQIESFEVDSGDNPDAPTRYAPVDFDGASQLTLTDNQDGGYWNGITFHAEDGTNNTSSMHAYGVAEVFYGDNSVAYPYVTDVYNAATPTFLADVVQIQSSVSATGPLPGNFDGGAKIIENAYVASEPSNLDAIERLDYMINQDDVVFVAAASSAANNDVAWACYNSLAVGGTGFDPSGSVGKTHADVSGPGLASFVEGAVASYATALYGHAQAASQTDALHGPVIRSLLMAGTDKTDYTRQTSNNLDASFGAGQADYNTSLTILNNGEQPIEPVGAGGSISGVPSWNEKGWAYGPIAAGGQSAILFHADGGLTGLSASLNWNVSQPLNATDSNELDTAASPIFPNLTLEVRPVTYANGQSILGASYADVTLQSAAPNDNVQYLYYTGTLPAGNYAFVITGDPTLSPDVGFSYSITEPNSNQFALSAGGSWNSSASWPNGIPNAPAAHANFTAGPSGSSGGTVTLDGNQTVGQLVFDNPQSYTIAPGSGGTLTINDTGDANGVNPSITIISGSHTISAPVALANGVTVSTTAASTLTISGNITGSGGLTATGQGTLTLSGIDNYGDTTVSSGTLTVATGGVLSSPNLTVSPGATLNANGSLGSSTTLIANGPVNFGPNTGSGILARPLNALSISAGNVVKVALPTSGNESNRTVLIASALTLAGSAGDWQGQLDLTSNDMIVHTGNLAQITDQIESGLNAVNGYWNGQGITSSTAAQNTGDLTALGVMLNSNDGSPIYTTFDGQAVTTTDVLVKYTYYGDANLDGKIDTADYSIINAGFTDHLTGWSNGDFNYDGVIDGSDYTLMDNAVNATDGSNISTAPADMIAGDVAEIAGGSTSAVPEPATMAMLLPAMVLMYRRRRTPQY